MYNRLRALVAQRADRERRRITLKEVSERTGVSRYTVHAMANYTLREYPGDALDALCAYLECGIGDLLVVERKEGIL